MAGAPIDEPANQVSVRLPRHRVASPESPHPLLLTAGCEPVSVPDATVDVVIDNEPDRVEVEELHPGLGGVWIVVTQGSRHEWDLDSMTYMRIPGPDSESGSFALDGQRMPITRVDRWPRVGSTSLVFYDDPGRPLDYEHFRRSSRIDSITLATGSKGPGRPSTGYLLLDALAEDDDPL